MFGGIEAGGTKFVCGIGTGPEDLEIEQFPTSSPDITLKAVLAFFRNASRRVQSIGIGSFGPVDLHESSPDYGHITSTPKPGWANFDLLGAVRGVLHVPVAFDTDGNAALLGEARWGAAQGLSDAIYMTIGTGIGGGALVHGRVVHGLVHPEMGHLQIPHDLTHDPFPGACPYHKDCLEGLASGPAIQARWRTPAGTLPPYHPGWELEAHYLALGLVNLTVTLSPQRILLGGGVMQQPHLFEMIRKEFKRLLNDYVRHREVGEHLNRFIQPPALGSRAGVLGTLVLAEQALARESGTLAGQRA
ncbi:MAG TPA: ROK family protein [Bryobacteraceae bacterium]|jgi:fructokinase